MNLPPTEKPDPHIRRLVMRMVWDGYGWEDIAVKTGIHPHTITRQIRKMRALGMLSPRNFKPMEATK